MKKIIMAAIGLTALMTGPALMAGGKREKVEISFDELKGLEDKKGRTLDGSIKFYFADEKSSLKGGEEISARGNTMQKGSQEDRCVKAMLAAFISFQERAKRDGKTAVVDVRTFSEADVSSGSRKKCLCVGGNLRTGTTVKGRLAGGK